MNEQQKHRLLAVMLAHAIGDAIGFTVEFATGDAVVRGLGGEHPTAYLPERMVSDDTQMSLFALEGLALAGGRFELGSVRDAFVRWRLAQDGVAGDPRLRVGWLALDPLLRQVRAPGNACLRGCDELATDPHRFVGSLEAGGCGGVMRAAPFGFVPGTVLDAFVAGVRQAQLTHGHPRGYLPAGMLAAIVRMVAVDGASVGDAVRASCKLAGACAGGPAIVDIVNGMMGSSSREAIERGGGGWVGDHALAIAVACALVADNEPSLVPEAIWRAAKHNGDSDSTAAICGAMLGARWGIDAVPAAWWHVDALEAIERTVGRFAMSVGY